jgi:GH15 family glucan-1,4-alpha-glucosidase
MTCHYGAMPLHIEDYALIGDCHTGALVGRDGSIDWLCLPQFDSASTFAAVLGSPDQGRWSVAPVGAVLATSRRYLDGTFVLVTRWETSTGEVEVVDFMPHGGRRADVVRRIRGVRGRVRMHQDVRLRFDYAATLPWIRQAPEEGGDALVAIAGPDAVVMRGMPLEPDNLVHRSEFDVTAGQGVDLTLTWFPAHRDVPPAADIDAQLESTVAWWRTWGGDWSRGARYGTQVERSLLVLRALTHEDTGGIVAAPTTSLPESIGNGRNWDYRYVWLRDASLTLGALLDHGFSAEAESWRGWLLRAVAGDPADIQIMYGLAGERRLPEWEVSTLPGYEDSAPVRVGNDAYRQYQGDVFGEVMIALRSARDHGVAENGFSWGLQRALLEHVESTWRRPDTGIWEIRGPERDFTHSRAMLWAAFDCGIRAVREHGMDGPADRWEHLREEIRAEIEERGFSRARNTYTQFFDGDTVDASLLRLAQIGYVAPDDPRMLGTVAALETHLLRDGLLLRYETESGVDGLTGDEHPFLACSFWLVEQYARSGRVDDAIGLMDRLVGFTNDVGLLSEEYDVGNLRQIGNFPQALSHLALVRAADAIESATTLEQ